MNPIKYRIVQASVPFQPQATKRWFVDKYKTSYGFKNLKDFATEAEAKEYLQQYIELTKARPHHET